MKEGSFDFKDCHKTDQQEFDDLTDVEVYDDKNDDADRDEQIFEFVEVPSFVTGSNTEPLYFVQVTEKGISEKKLSDPYGHVILPGERYFKGYYLKFIRSRSISFKQLQVLPTSIVLSPDEIYDTYVDTDEQVQLDINVNDILVFRGQSEFIDILSNELSKHM